jgi:alkylhydroperoxidase/carboxymuconolactone decarboxylase family protein YurZ
MKDRHAGLLKELLDVVGGPTGELDAAKRRALLEGKPVTGALGSFAIKVHHNANSITDEHVAQLKAAGSSEDQIFECVLAAALGAGVERLEAVRKLLGVVP